MDRFEGQTVYLNPMASSITIPITAVTLPTSLSYFISIASLSYFPPLLISRPFLFSLSFFSYSLTLILLSLSLFNVASSLQRINSQLFSPFSSFLCLFVSWCIAIFLLSPVFHYISHILLSLLLHPPPLSFSVPEALGSQQWIITHLRNSVFSILLVQLDLGLSINQSIGVSRGRTILPIPHAGI